MAVEPQPDEFRSVLRLERDGDEIRCTQAGVDHEGRADNQLDAVIDYCESIKEDKHGA